MNLYSDEFLKDVKSVPVRANLYLYIFRSGRITEYLVEFKLYDYMLISINSYRTKSSCTVQVLKRLTEGDNYRIPKSFSVSTESGVVNNNKLWLMERDIDQAKQLFIKDKQARIQEYNDKINDLKAELDVLEKI